MANSVEPGSRSQSRREGDAALIESLHQRLVAALGPVFGGAVEADLIDYPDHYNVGDAALWLGERAILRELGVRTRGAATRATYRAERLRADGPLVILGGGNFGGLYPTHHRLHVEVLAAFTGRPLIQLPQSLHYAGEEQRDELRRAVAEHGATTLVFRDSRSFELGRRDFDCEVILAPDMAFGLGALRRRPPERALVAQMRTDKESAVTATQAGTFDWLTARATESVAVFDRLYRYNARLQRASDRAWVRQVFIGTCDAYARANLRRGVAMLSAGQRLYTDRLHGHILACLLGVEHTVVNDRHGKIEAMWDTWTSAFDCAHFARSWDEVESDLGATW
jgi:exopolysaccharide biosynthesis protein PssK